MAEPAVVPEPSSCPRIAEIPPAHRPREKLRLRGPRALSAAELIALLVGSGTKRDGVLHLATRLVRRHGLAGMQRLTAGEWRRTEGVGQAVACRLAAAFEIARRLRLSEEREPPRVSHPEEAWRQAPELRRARKEHLVALYLDAQNRLLARETVTIGSLNTTRTHPREILYPAIQHLALGFILLHNHPSGSLTPSADDVEFTRAVRRAGELMGIELYDHLIVSERGFVSLREKGLL